MLATQVIFSTLPIATKLVLPAVEPLGIAMVRICGAAVAFAVVKWNRTAQRVVNARDFLRLAGLALLGVVLNQVLFLEGVRRTTAVHTNILITTIPVFTLAVALALGRESASLPKLGGIALAGAGAAYLALARGGADGASVSGDLLVAANSVCYAGYLVLSKDLLRRYEPMTVVTWVFLIGAVLIAPLGIPALMRVHPEAVTRRIVLVLVYIVVFPSFLTYLLSIWALRRTASSLVAMYVYVQPIVTAFAAPLILGERVTSRAGVASALIFSGLALATWGEQIAGGQLGRAFRPPAEGA